MANASVAAAKVKSDLRFTVLLTLLQVPEKRNNFEKIALRLGWPSNFARAESNPQTSG